ncbi:MAG: hypothetical protein M3069_01335 [Chloroflexota bacterium]|nr:hypothetical protein [Chloroflexota bacterium]
MVDDDPQPRGVHLVGSLPLASSSDVFRTAGEILGERLLRLPDGETGVRSDWIRWQMDVLTATPGLEMAPPSTNAYVQRPQVQLSSESRPSEVTFGPLGYARAARDSYAQFEHMKEDGVIARSCRFQVSLPTPLAVVNSFVARRDRAALEPAYERRLLAELDEITEAIPHTHLAAQWDVAIEIGILEGVIPSHLTDPRREIIDRLVRLGNRVPGEVELGYHLCYGDAGHRHFKQPEDTGLLVDVANALSAAVTRPIQWIHLPVPRERSDEAFFAPLRSLRLHPETRLYLGLVHYTDGVAGTQRRIAAARRTCSDFGVATECGMGRRPPETIPDLLRIHAEVSAHAA